MATTYKQNTLSNTVIPPEWYPQDGILLAWPHSETDWNYMLEDAQACFKAIVSEMVCDNETILIATPEPENVSQQLVDIDTSSIRYYKIQTNDTWARDFGPVTILRNGLPILLNFQFNAWGMKFAADKDNQINTRLDLMNAFNSPLENHLDFVLEGGSIESDGNGALMTNYCLTAPNRNSMLTKAQIEEQLKAYLGIKHIIWLSNGGLVGDDTDGHIDTLARFAPSNTILYVNPSEEDKSEQAQSLREMEKELQHAVNADGDKYNLVPLPCPDPIFDNNGEQLPATYANFLIMNNQILVPIYRQKHNDHLALDIIQSVFPNHNVKGIDCNALIQQHGSLHCVTMQLPQNTLSE